MSAIGHTETSDMVSSLVIAGTILSTSLISVLAAMMPSEDLIAAWCWYGAGLGSGWYILHAKAYRQEDVLWVFCGNGLLAFLGSSPLCAYGLPFLGFEPRQTACVAISGLVAALIPWIIRDLIPIFKPKAEAGARSVSFKALIARLLNITPSDTKPPRKRPTKNADE